MDWLLYGICGVSALLTLIVSLRSGKGIRYFAISSACGVALLLVLTAFGRKVGMTVLGLEVNHAHIHLAPLQNEGDMDFWKDKKHFTPEEMADTAARILKAFR